MDRNNHSVPIGSDLETGKIPADPNTGGAASWPHFDAPPCRFAIEAASEFECKASKGESIPKPADFPEGRWSEMTTSERAVIAGRAMYGDEDWAWHAEEEPFLTSWAGSPEGIEWNSYQGPQRHPEATATLPGSMVGDGESKPSPWEVWQAIQKIAKDPSCLRLPRSEARNLWLVYTGRTGKLMLLVCTWCQLKKYAGGTEPCPVLIQGHQNLMTITGEAASLSGWGKTGFAANGIQRLAYFYDDQASNKAEGSAEDAMD